MSLTQFFILGSAVPTLLLPIVVATVALVGLSRARRTVLVLSMCALVLYTVAEVGIRTFPMYQQTTTSVPTPVVTPEYAISYVSLNASVVAANVGGLLALLRTAQSRRWLWFGGLVVGTLITAVAELAFNSFIVIQLVGSNTAQALFKDQIYVVVTTGLVTATMVAQLLYGFLGPNDAKTGENAKVPAVSGSSSD
jgi:hypothetical protein